MGDGVAGVLQDAGIVREALHVVQDQAWYRAGYLDG
jgi:hypothetical protein